MTIYAPRDPIYFVRMGDANVCNMRNFSEAERFQIQMWFLRGRQAMQRAALRELSPDYNQEKTKD